MDGKAEVVLRFALSTLLMKQGRPIPSRVREPRLSVEAETCELAFVSNDLNDNGFGYGEGDTEADAYDARQADEEEDGRKLLLQVLSCMGRLRDVCDGSCQGGGREVEEGFRAVANELRYHTALHGNFPELMRLLLDLLRAADTEGETMDAASISHVLTRLCFEDSDVPSSRFDEVVEFLVAALNEARNSTLTDWITQSLDEVEAVVHGSR